MRPGIVLLFAPFILSGFVIGACFILGLVRSGNKIRLTITAVLWAVVTAIFPAIWGVSEYYKNPMEGNEPAWTIGIVLFTRFLELKSGGVWDGFMEYWRGSVQRPGDAGQSS